MDLQDPRAGKVPVEVQAAGTCHSDDYTRLGADPEGLLPAILGPEGAGVVLEAGANVPWLKAGDPVIPLYTPECRHCKFCLSRKTQLRQTARSTQGKGLMPDGTSRFSIGCGVTTSVVAVLFSAKVEAGANVAAFGLGGTGLSVIQGAKRVGVDKTIGVDLNPTREAIERKFGTPHAINPKAHANLATAIRQLTDGGADYSFACTGNTQ